MNLQKIKKTIVPLSMIIFLLSMIILNAIDIIFLRIPNFNMLNKSYREKIELISEESETLSQYYKVFLFVNDSVEQNSSVLFFDQDYFILGQPFLYPRIKSFFVGYSNDENFLNYLKENEINYVLIIDRAFPLSSDTLLFTKIELNSTKYLLRVNREEI